MACCEYDAYCDSMGWYPPSPTPSEDAFNDFCMNEEKEPFEADFVEVYCELCNKTDDSIELIEVFDESKWDWEEQLLCKECAVLHEDRFEQNLFICDECHDVKKISTNEYHNNGTGEWCYKCYKELFHPDLPDTDDEEEEVSGEEEESEEEDSCVFQHIKYGY
jgi:hypothetical protein